MHHTKAVYYQANAIQNAAMQLQAASFSLACLPLLGRIAFVHQHTTPTLPPVLRTPIVLSNFHFPQIVIVSW